MSQHYFYTEYQNTPVSVLMGYDRMLNGYFMVIEKEIDFSDEMLESEGFKDDSLIYSNLFEANPHPKSLSKYIDKLTELGLTVPSEMLSEIESDFERSVGNKFVIHKVIDGVHTREQR